MVFGDVPLHLQIDNFIAQGFVLGPQFGEAGQRLGRRFLRDARVFPLPMPQIRRIEAQFGGDFVQALAAALEKLYRGVFELFVVLFRV